MNILYHYHHDLVFCNGSYYGPEFAVKHYNKIATLINEFRLISYVKKAKKIQSGFIRCENIIVYDIGEKPKFPISNILKSFIFYKKLVKKVKSDDIISKCDAVILEVPTGFAPYLARIIPSNKLFLYFVGEMVDCILSEQKRDYKFFINLIYFYLERCALFRIGRKCHVINGTSFLNKIHYQKVKYIAPPCVRKSSPVICSNTYTDKDLYDNIEKPLRDVKHFITARRISPETNIRSVIDISIELKKSNFNFKWDIFGSGEQLNYYIERTKSLKLNNNITWHGEVSNRTILQYLKNCDLYIDTCTHALGYGRAVYDSFSQSVPVIMHVRAMDFFTRPNDDVLFFKSSCPEVITCQIINFFKDKQNVVRVRKNCFHVAQKHSLDSETKFLVDYIERTVVKEDNYKRFLALKDIES